MLLRTLKPAAAAARLSLVCLPHAGGSASAYYRFGQHFGDGVEVLGVQYPGHGDRVTEPLCTEVAALVRMIADALAGHERRFALVGLSFGALVGFEVARELRRRGAPGPAFLALGGRTAPQLISGASSLYGLPPERFVDAVIELYGDPDGLLRDPDIAELALPPLRADIDAAAEWRYREEPPLAVPLLAFGGREDRELTEERLGAWRAQTRGPFTQLMVPGGHFVFTDGAPEVARAIQRQFGMLL